MLTTRLRELLDQAISGDANAWRSFQIEKFSLYADDRTQTEERLFYFEALHMATVSYFLQQQDISASSSGLLYVILNAVYADKNAAEISILNDLLERATIKCSDNPLTCNVAGIQFAVLFFKTYLSKKIKPKTFYQLLLLQPDDAEGVVSYVQSKMLEKYNDKERMLIKLQQSLQKNNPMALFRQAELLYAGQDLTELDRANPIHKKIIKTLVSATSQGFPKAFYFLASIFQMQKTTDELAQAENRQNAINYFMQGIDAGDPGSMYGLAELYFELFPNDNKKIAEATLLLNFAASKWHHINSQLLLAKFFMQNLDKDIDIQVEGNNAALQLLNDVIAAVYCPEAIELERELSARIETLNNFIAGQNMSSTNDDIAPWLSFSDELLLTPNMDEVEATLIRSLSPARS